MQRKEYIAFIFAHIAMFVTFVWFGALKLWSVSPAGPMVVGLFDMTLGSILPFLTPDMFMIIFGAFEVLIGVLFIIPRMEKLAIALLIPHLISTILPLFLMPAMTWAGPFEPTLEGQYIIKNIIIIALVATVLADLNKKRAKKPWSTKEPLRA